MIRSIFAIFVGLITNIILSLLSDSILKTLNILPNDHLFVSTPIVLFVLGYRIGFSILGCYLAARLAPEKPMMHSFLLGGIGMILGTIGALLAGHLGPWWYSWSLVILSPLVAYLGGKLYLQEGSNR